MSSVEQNIAKSKMFTEKIGQDRTLGFVDELLSPDHVWHDATAPNLPQGPQGARQFLSAYVTAFPDLKLTVADSFGAGDKVATRWIAEGTNTGSLEGQPPTSKKVRVEGVTIDCYDADGRIAESWNSWDSQNFLMQLGIQPEVPAATKKPEQRPGIQ